LTGPVVVRPLARRAGPDGQDLLVVRDTGQTFVAPSAVADLLFACVPFRTLREHARVIGARLGVEGERLAELEGVIRGFEADGLLVSLDAIRVLGREATPPPKITSVGMVTCGRPAAAARAARSYLANVRAYGRGSRLVVSDDSPDPEDRRATRDGLENVAREFGDGILTYLGREERSAFAAALAHESGVERALVDFALFGDTQCRGSIGANRNTLQLATCGELVLSVDDDTECKVARPPHLGSLEGVTFRGDRDPQEFWFHADREAALAAGAYVETDVLAEHERLLGFSLAALVARPDSEANLDEICAEAVSSLATGRGWVGLTLPGILGDSGMHSGGLLLSLGLPTHARLVASEGSYRIALSSRAVQRGVRSYVVAHDASFAATVYGIDNRKPIAPFLPVLRNEDGLLVDVLAKCFKDFFIGFPPHALVHAPIEQRAFPKGAYLAAAGEARFSEILGALVRTHPLPYGDGSTRLRELGRHLVAVASQPLEDFRVLLRATLAQNGAARVAWLGNIVRERPDAPAFWRSDVLAQLDIHRQALTSPTFWLASDLREDLDEGATAELMRRLVRRYGELLVVWDALASAAPRAWERSTRAGRAARG
jgi:hypothetical protein